MRRLRSRAGRAIQYFLLIPMLIFLLFPIYWMVNTSFKEMAETHRLPTAYLPRNPTFEGYQQVIEVWRFGSTFVNTALVATAAGLGATVIGTAAGYGFTRFVFRGKGISYGFIVTSMALPGMAIVGPLFFIFKDVGLLDTKTGLVIVDLIANIPFAVYFLYSFFQGIPRELDEAGLIDGCSRLGVLWHLILPLSTSGLAITFIISFISVWNEYLFAFILTISEDARVLTARLAEIPMPFMIPYNLMAVGGILCLLPIVLLVVFGQRYIIEGIIAGSVKG
jgi:multiple sugar transport system permease protein